MSRLPGDFSSPFLRACECCKNGYKPDEQHQMLGSWPVWDEGYFESKEGDYGGGYNDDGMAGTRSAYSSQRLRGNRRSSNRDWGVSVHLSLVNKTLESLDPHTMVVPEPYQFPDPTLRPHRHNRRPSFSQNSSSSSSTSQTGSGDHASGEGILALSSSSSLSSLPSRAEGGTNGLLEVEDESSGEDSISDEPFLFAPVDAATHQPFRIEVHPDVAFVCDFHAHLADSEIIGLLGGYWDRENRTIYIQVRAQTSRFDEMKEQKKPKDLALFILAFYFFFS